ncbi:MAG: phosphoglucosamine mutase [Acidobacteriota bacterium]|nr:phosphoglucosamine mutase [Acidobacteriota bacterium]
MKKLFGTDGIRAVAGQAPLDPATIYAVGLALAHHLAPAAHAKAPRVLIGQDTRESSDWIAATLTAGLTHGGAEVESAGVITTPAVAFLAKAHGFSAGIVISASHNPWQDNGIKLFGPDGFKLADSTELAIETEIFRHVEFTTKSGAPGLAFETWDRTTATPPPVNEADRTEYIRFLLDAVPDLSLAGRRIVVACANGAASAIAPQLFAQLNSKGGGEVILTHASPNGRNINANCGALHPKIVAKEVLAQKASMGITFDGDADRALFADENGKVVNGDAVLLLAARHLQALSLLTNDTVVATTMSNMGLEAALKRSGIKMLRAPVGDKYVLEQMLSTGAALGGEQSGHIIFSGRSTTGDGILTALLLLDIVHQSGKTLAELTADLKTFPQVIVNVHVREKRPLDQIATVAAAIAAAEAALADSGRVVIRYSGTEALARVMIEAESEPLMQHHSQAIANAIRTELGV